MNLNEKDNQMLAALLRKQRRDRAHDNIEYFASYYLPHILQDKTPSFHREIRKLLLKETRLGIAAPRGFAKAQSIDSMVLTQNRWKRLREIKIGDYIIGQDGKPKKVLDMTPIMKMELYRITTRDGRSTLCNLEHLWKVQCPQNCKNKNWNVRTLKWIFKNYKTKRLDKRNGKYYQEYKYFLDWSKPIVFSEKKLILDPYTLGAWLGDGTSADGGFTTNDQEILSYFPYKISPRKPKLRYTILGIRGFLDKLNLLNNKHIPEIYLFGSIGQRIELLQGLIDTDGSIVKGGKIIEFCNKNRKLIGDICYLIRSLGGTATIGDGISKCNGRDFHYYKITARFPKEIIPVKLSRKRKLWTGSIKTKSAIIDVHFEKNDYGRCLNVEDDYYITDDFLLTHNSTNVQIIYAIHCLLFNKNDDILSISQSYQMAEDWVRKIKFELEGNERIKDDFGQILQWGEKESKRWTADHLVIQQENQVFSQIRARGRGCQVRGLRPTRVFCDDLEDDEMVRSEDQRKYLKEWFFGALLNVLKPDQQLVVIGTILHPLSLIADIIDKKEQFSGWVTKKYKALENGKSLWQARFSVKALLKRKAEIGSYAFESEYQNNPIASDICLWRPEWIKKYTVLPQIKMKMVALDPAGSEKESADYSALSCFGLGIDGNIYEIESIKGRWGTWDLIEHCIKFYMRHKPLRFGIEQVALQGFIKPVLIAEARKQGIYMPIESLSLGKYTGVEKEKKSPKDKYTRALSIIHLYEQGVVYLTSEALIDQIKLFPTGSEDDLVDASVYVLRMLTKYSPVKFMTEKPVKRVNSFTVGEDRRIPPFETIEDCFKKETSWKIG